MNTVALAEWIAIGRKVEYQECNVLRTALTRAKRRAFAVLVAALGDIDAGAA
jgi:hypothetical protein